MKKVLYIVLALMISACSSSDDPAPFVDPVIGVWKPVIQGAIFNDGSELTEAVSVCEQKNRITFMADGAFSQTDYQESNDPDCVQPVGNPFLTGTWTRLSESKYRVELICSIPNCNDVEVEIPESITFPNPNVMRVTDIDEDDLTDDIDFYFLEFERVQ